MSEKFNLNLLTKENFIQRNDKKNYLTQKDYKHIKERYQEHIKNNNTNEIELSELKQALTVYGVDFENDEKLKHIFNELEKNGVSYVDFDEFINIITSRIENIDSMNELQKVFCLFLGEENVDKIEFKHIKNALPHFSDDEIKEMIEKADEDKNGKIKFEEFYNIVTKLI